MRTSAISTAARGIYLHFCLLVLTCFLGTFSLAQGTGTLTGKITDSQTGDPLNGVSVRLKGTSLGGSTDQDGRYRVTNVPVGTYTLALSAVGYMAIEVPNVQVNAEAVTVSDASMTPSAIPISETIVYGASLRPEKITEAPAAVSTVSPEDIQQQSSHGQLPMLVSMLPGVDVVQSGVQDFNVNARGFNKSINRRVLVLMDGRDMSIVLLGVQEWNGLSLPLEDLGRIEFIRGPGSALYGANAYNGVLNITSLSPKEVIGTKVAVTGGQLSTLRADIRHGGTSNEWSYRVNVGGVKTDTWSKSRTTAPLEYPGLPIESKPYDVDQLSSLYGSGRVDRDFADGSFLTLEGGITQVENEIFLTGIGRVWVPRARKPWGRLAFTSDHLFAQFWGSGRVAMGPHYALSSGAELKDLSDNFQVEFQHNFTLLDDQLRVVWGASHRYQHEETEQTLIPFTRYDNSSGLFGQVDYKFSDNVKVIATGRFDRNTLFDAQFSPKAGLVITPVKDHSFRATFNQAFQVPNYSELFLRADASAPTTSPRQLEVGLEGYFAAVKAAFGSAVAQFNLPSNLPWEFSPTTRVLALGNNHLDVEKITGWEIGYKGVFENKLYLTFDTYYNKLKNFVTALLPGVNPDYPSYSLTDGGTNVPKNLNDLEAFYNQIGLPAGHPLRANLAALRAGYLALNAQLGPYLATIGGNQRAGVLSYTNAGRVNEYGFELGGRFYFTNELALDANWSYFRFEVKEQKLGDLLLPNTPQNKINVGLAYSQWQGFNAGINVKWVQKFPWAGGVFNGDVPEYTLVNLIAGYHLSKNLHFGVNAFNILDRKHYEIFGGSILERRVVGTVTTYF